MAQTPFAAWLQTARGLGIYRYILPFLITFLVVYGILEKVRPFGRKQRRVHTLFAIIVALFLIAFVPGSVLGGFFSNFIGAVAVAMVGLTLVMAVYGIVFGDPTADSGLAKGVGAIGAVVVLVLFIAWGGLGIIYPGIGEGVSLGSVLGPLIVLGLLGLIFWALGGE